VIDGFMIQGGDPTATGGGNVGFTIKDELSPALKFDKAGVLAMANAGPNTGSSQFFITLAPTPHLNGAHTIFGQAVEGMDVVNAIGKVPTRNEKPVKAVVIQTIKFERVGPAPANDVPAGAKPAAPAKKAAPPKKAAPAKKPAPAKKAAPAK
jgi:cyclophilin family peptidyl-prolyl cis-trans isomerase